MARENIYYLGLDIGTDSVGYAVTDENYTLKKFKGEPMWGATLFEAANTAAERRGYRTARRRLDRKQQRVSLLNELFAEEIGKTDPHFFIRRRESALYGEDPQFGVKLFDGEGITDKEYHKKYPTIHHLILELMNSSEPHDVRLVYMACAWLVANRGHFLFDVPEDRVAEVLDFNEIYRDFCEYLTEQGCVLPWSIQIKAETILEIMQMETGVKKKNEEFKAKLFGGGKPSKEITEETPFSAEAVVNLLAGRKVKPAELFGNMAYAEVDSVSLTMNDEEFVRIAAELDEDGGLLRKLRAMSDCAQLKKAMKDADCISEGKVAIYEQHKADLKTLKYLVKKYCSDKYNEFFRAAVKDNYVFYTRHMKSLPEEQQKEVKSIAGKDAFSDFTAKRMKAITVEEKDKRLYDDMMERLEARTFLPKQKDGDNRVIPQQLYHYELAELLNRAKGYCSLLNETDADGISVAQKILSIFEFKIPYFVGPLRKNDETKNAWIVRKAEGKILPWNFEQMVDLDASEKGFIERMTNRCTYLPDEEVLPVNSLLYSRFMVLNELNNLKVNDRRISVEAKQKLFRELFEDSLRVTPKKIRDYLLQHGYMEKTDVLSGLDETIKSGLKPYHIFKRLLSSGVLTEADAEEIIKHAAYSEDKPRMRRWLKERYPQLKEEDAAYILRQNLKEFGRLSERFLTGIYGTERNSDGEAYSIIEMLWNTNENLMQLLSDRYTFSEQITHISEEYYADCPRSLNDRLSEMYISNAVKRPIFRTADIVQEVVKVMGAPPAKIFVEMARGGTPEQKGKRTQTRKNQLLELYKKIKSEDTRRLTEKLEEMGMMADNRLQSDRLFLYYLQLGRCAYTGQPIDLEHLTDGTYNLDHIYPQCYVKDDSITNNLVLVKSELNGRKSDSYPLPEDIRGTMSSFWKQLKETGLMTEEKYRRLTRQTPFTNDEKQGFINRQLVETRQSTKAVTTLLQERFRDTEVVYVKAGMVSEFRQDFDLLKCRTVNDLHHAKDAYLNIVVGNVYHERFTKNWFSLDSSYNVQVKKIFQKQQRHGETCYWNGEEDIARIKKTMAKNAVHLTRYAFCRKGGLFDQQPVKKGENLIPLKNGMPTEKYGGYNKPTASFFVLARYEAKGKREVMIVPVNLIDADRFIKDAEFAATYTAEMIERITGKALQKTELLLNGRPLKVNTVFSLDGTLVTLSGKSSGGKKVGLAILFPLLMGNNHEMYIKAMESFLKKRETNPALQPDQKHDKLSKEENLILYDRLINKLRSYPYCNLPGNQAETLEKGREKFIQAEVADQINCLVGLMNLLNAKGNTCDLSLVGGAPQAGTIALSSSLSNWKKKYHDVRIIDRSAAGLFESTSENLLELL